MLNQVASLLKARQIFGSVLGMLLCWATTPALGIMASSDGFNAQPGGCCFLNPVARGDVSSGYCAVVGGTFTSGAFSTGASCELSSEQYFTRTASSAGGSTTYDVHGISLGIITTGSETDSEITTLIADAINANVSLQLAGVSASSSGDNVSVNAEVTSLVIGDVGINGTTEPPPPPPPPPPTNAAPGISNWYLAIAGALILVFGLFGIGKRNLRGEL